MKVEVDFLAVPCSGFGPVSIWLVSLWVLGLGMGGGVRGNNLVFPILSKAPTAVLPTRWGEFWGLLENDKGAVWGHASRDWTGVDLRSREGLGGGFLVVGPYGGGVDLPLEARGHILHFHSWKQEVDAGESVRVGLMTVNVSHPQRCTHQFSGIDENGAVWRLGKMVENATEWRKIGKGDSVLVWRDKDTKELRVFKVNVPFAKNLESNRQDLNHENSNQEGSKGKELDGEGLDGGDYNGEPSHDEPSHDEPPTSLSSTPSFTSVSADSSAFSIEYFRDFNLGTRIKHYRHRKVNIDVNELSRWLRGRELGRVSLGQELPNQISGACLSKLDGMALLDLRVYDTTHCKYTSPFLKFLLCSTGGIALLSILAILLCCTPVILLLYFCCIKPRLQAAQTHSINQPLVPPDATEGGEGGEEERGWDVVGL